MRRRLGADVSEGDTQIVFVHDLRRDFAGDDFFEECHGYFMMTRNSIFFARIRM